MASWQSRPAEFSPYVPQVDSQLYGQLLAKKEREYQAGVQRIESSLSSIASLPVSSIGERDYLQQKLSNITTELNQSFGTDWSDRNLNNLTTKHITAIADDPIVQTAVLNANNYKRDYQKAADSLKESGGKDVANQAVWMDYATKWQREAKPGDSYRPSFVPWFDKDKYIEEEFNKFDKDVVEQLQTGGGLDKDGKYSSWELAIRKVKGSNEWKTKVLNHLETLVENTPGLKSQMAVDAIYSYKDRGPQRFIQELATSNATIIKRYTSMIADKDRLLTGTIKPEERTIIEEEKKQLQEKRDSYVKPLDYYIEAGSKYITDPQFKREIDNRMYKESFISGKFNKYTAGTEETWTYQGMSPLQQKEADWKKQKDLHDMKNEDERLKIALREIELKERKEKKQDEIDHPYVPKTGIDKDQVGKEWLTFTANIDAQKANLNQQKVDWLYNLYSTKTGNADEYFYTDYAGPYPVIRIRPEKQKDVDITLAQFLNKKRSGAYRVAGAEIQLTESDIDALSTIDDEEKNLTQEVEYMQSVEKDLLNRNKTDKNTILNKKVAEYNTNPLVVRRGNDTYSFTGDELNRVAKTLQELKFLRNSAVKGQYYNTSMQDIFNKNGITNKHLILLDGGGKGDVTQPAGEFSDFANSYEKQNKVDIEYLNDRVRHMNLLYQGNDVVISHKGETDSEVESSMEHALSMVKTYGANNGWESANGNVQSIVTKAESSDRKTKPVITQGWDNIKKKYYYGIQVGTDYDRLWVRPQDAKLMGFEDLMPRQTTLSKRLTFNKGKNGDYYSTAFNGKMDIENALTLSVKDGVEYRYHVTHNSKGFYTTIYSIDINTGKATVVPDKQGRVERYSGTSEYELNNTLQSLKDQ